jgi:hypothetical protein
MAAQQSNMPTGGTRLEGWTSDRTSAELGVARQGAHFEYRWEGARKPRGDRLEAGW